MSVTKSSRMISFAICTPTVNCLKTKLSCIMVTIGDRGGSLSTSAWQQHLFFSCIKHETWPLVRIHPNKLNGCLFNLLGFPCLGCNRVLKTQQTGGCKLIGKSVYSSSYSSCNGISVTVQIDKHWVVKLYIVHFKSLLDPEWRGTCVLPDAINSKWQGLHLRRAATQSTTLNECSIKMH